MNIAMNRPCLTHTRYYLACLLFLHQGWASGQARVSCVRLTSTSVRQILQILENICTRVPIRGRPPCLQCPQWPLPWSFISDPVYLACIVSHILRYLSEAGATPKSMHVVYINTSLYTKAAADARVPTITCTSSNVVQTVLQGFAQVGLRVLELVRMGSVSRSTFLP